MNTLAIGDRVSLTKEALSLSYVKGRHWYTDVYEGKTGTIIGYTADCSKLAIQFDEKIFTRPNGQISSHDNGCHGKGKRQYSWYFPICCVTKIKVVNNNKLLLLL
jgi:hypothetical protein